MDVRKKLRSSPSLILFRGSSGDMCSPGSSRLSPATRSRGSLRISFDMCEVDVQLEGQELSLKQAGLMSCDPDLAMGSLWGRTEEHMQGYRAWPKLPRRVDACLPIFNFTYRYWWLRDDRRYVAICASMPRRIVKPRGCTATAPVVCLGCGG